MTSLQNKIESDPPPPESEMGLLEHLRELRKRLVYSFLFIVVGAVAAYSYSNLVFDILNEPYRFAFPQNILIGTGPAEAFMIRIKVAFFVGAILSSPLLFTQVWLFVAPGLYEHEKKMLIPFVVISSFLFLAGISLCYYFVLPLAFKFFHEQYQAIGIVPEIKISELLSVMVSSLLGFGVVFELPVLAYFLGRAGIINHRMMISSARYAVFAIFVVSAVLTPPDVLSQFLMATPLTLLYAVSILVVKWAEPKQDH